MFTQSIEFYISLLHIKEYRYLEKVILRSTENERLLISATFTAKFELVFVITLENAFFQRFHFKTSRKSMDAFMKQYQGFLK